MSAHSCESGGRAACVLVVTPTLPPRTPPPPQSHLLCEPVRDWYSQLNSHLYDVRHDDQVVDEDSSFQHDATQKQEPLCRRDTLKNRHAHEEQEPEGEANIMRFKQEHAHYARSTRLRGASARKGSQIL